MKTFNQTYIPTDRHENLLRWRKEVSDEMKYMYICLKRHRILLQTQERRKLRTDKGRKQKPF